MTRRAQLEPRWLVGCKSDAREKTFGAKGGKRGAKGGGVNPKRETGAKEGQKGQKGTEPESDDGLILKDLSRRPEAAEPS